MDKSTEIVNELQSISPLLASLEKVNPFLVPDGYFVSLEQHIHTSLLLNHVEKGGNQYIPEGYFDKFSTKILSRIKKEELNDCDEEIRSVSPLLYSIRNSAVFTVPAHYFEQLSNEVLSRIPGQKARVIPIGSTKQWWKYAAAAMMAGVVAIASLLVLKNHPDPDPAGILTASANLPVEVKLSFQYKTPEQLNQGIASLSDDDIVNYLEKTGNITDDEQLTIGTDTKEMPDPDDYLIDENALNNYLNQIGVQGPSKNTQ